MKKQIFQIGLKKQGEKETYFPYINNKSIYDLNVIRFYKNKYGKLILVVSNDFRVANGNLKVIRKG